jgi:hypothetical protein
MSMMDALCPDFPFVTGCDAPKEPGSLVYVGVNAGPLFEVVAVAGRTAWVREPRTFRSEALVPLDHLRIAHVHAH